MDNIKKYSTYGLAYLLWVVSVVMGYWVVSTVRTTLITLLVVSSINRAESDARERFYAGLQVRAADVWSIVLMGLAMIVIIVLLENLYRTAVLPGKLWARFSLVTAIGFGVLFLARLTTAILTGVVETLSWGNFVAPIALFVAAALFCWLWVSIRAPKAAT